MAAVARHRLDQPVLAPVRAVVGLAALGKLVDRGRQVGQEPLGPREGFLLAFDLVVDGTVARMDVAAAQGFLVDPFAEPRHHRRAGHE